MNYFKMILSTIFATVIFALPVEAGILMVSEQESYFQNKEKLTSKAHIDKYGMRVESKGTNIDNIFIFNKSKEVFWIIDNREGTYMEMTKADLQKTQNKMEESMKMLEEQMKKIPPEQRQMMEEMMKGQSPMQGPKTVYKKTSSGVKVNKWICDKYEGYLNKEKKEEIWTTNWKKLGLNTNDFKVMEDMGDFFEGFSSDSPSFYKVGSEDLAEEKGYSGVPIKTISYSNGIMQDKMELKEILQKNFSSSLFDLPGGLKKKVSNFGASNL